MAVRSCQRRGIKIKSKHAFTYTRKTHQKLRAEHSEMHGAHLLQNYLFLHQQHTEDTEHRLTQSQPTYRPPCPAPSSPQSRKVRAQMFLLQQPPLRGEESKSLGTQMSYGTADRPLAASEL